MNQTAKDQFTKVDKQDDAAEGSDAKEASAATIPKEPVSPEGACDCLDEFD
jgi:hypothetical protein